MDGDKNLVDLAFAGEDLDFIYVMSETNLYKLSGLILITIRVKCYYLNAQEWESPEKMSPILLGLRIFRRSEVGGGSWQCCCRFKKLIVKKIQVSFRCFIYNNDANLT